jgi:hypothetical protein
MVRASFHRDEDVSMNVVRETFEADDEGMRFSSLDYVVSSPEVNLSKG